MVKPDKAWPEIFQNNINSSYFRNLHIPICVTLGILLEAIIIGRTGWQDYLGQWILNFLALHSGLYLAAFLTHIISKKLINENIGFQKCLEFCSFASGYLFLATIVGIVSNSFLAMIILSLYLFQIVYDGIRYFMPEQREKLGLHTLIIGSILIISPLVTKATILLLMPDIS